MAETSVIREFLVALGFKSDEAALKKFDEGITRATKAVLTLGAAVEATAIAVSIGVARFASNLEALYFASLRTGASAANLKAFDRAAQDFGTTAGEALDSVEGLARFLRNNPGGEGMLRSLGLQTRDPKTGRMRDTTDMLVDLGKTFAKMPMYLANQYAGMLGISEKTMLAIRNGEFSKELEKMRHEMRGTDWGKVTHDAHEFMENLRDLGTYIEVFGAQVEDALQKKLGISIKSVVEWLRINGPWLASRIADVVATVIKWAEWLGQKIAWLVGKLKEWDTATGGWSTKLIGLALVLKYLGGAEVIGGILALAGAFTKLGVGVAAAASGGTLGKILGLVLPRAGIVGAGIGLGWLLDHFFPNNPLAKFGNAIAGALFEHGDRFNEAIRAFTDHGWSVAQASGIVANLNAESGLMSGASGDNGQALGVAQWHPDRQAAFAKWAGHDLSHSTLQEQYGFVDYELRHGSQQKAGALLRAAQNAQQAGDSVSRYYERPAASDAEAARRGADAVSLAQYTTIHIDGSKDPAATGREVAAAQSRVNADLTRNLQVAVQ